VSIAQFISSGANWTHQVTAFTLNFRDSKKSELRPKKLMYFTPMAPKFPIQNINFFASWAGKEAACQRGLGGVYPPGPQRTQINYRISLFCWTSAISGAHPDPQNKPWFCFACTVKHGFSCHPSRGLVGFSSPFYLGSKPTLKCTHVSLFVTFLQKSHKGALRTLKVCKITFLKHCHKH
jgi:hypothetical protein